MIRRRRPKWMLCPFCVGEVVFEQRAEKRRNGYQRKYLACSECEEEIPRMYVEDYRSFPPVVVSAVGFPQHGKTVYFSSLFYTLRHMELGDRWSGFRTQCVNDESLHRLWEGVRELNRGQLPAATPKTFPLPTMVRIHGYPRVPNCTLVMYDTAGESFNRPKQLIQYARFVRRAQTILFFVSLPRIQADGEEPDEVLHKLLETYIVGMRELGARERSQNLVVVFTMADVLADFFGDEWDWLRKMLINAAPGDESNSGYHRGIKALSDHLHRFVERGLRARNFLNLSKSFFLSTSYSIVSALGAAPDGENSMATRVVPRRVFDPLLGVLRNSKRGFRKWGHGHMNRQQAVNILWREWASSDCKDRDYLLQLLDLLHERKGGLWGAVVLGVVMSVWSALALAPFSLFTAWMGCLYHGSAFNEIIHNGLGILAATTAILACLGAAAGCVLPWKTIFRIVLMSVPSAVLPYVGVFVILNDDDLVFTAGAIVLVAILIVRWGGETAAVWEAILFAGSYSLIPMVAIAYMWNRVEPSDSMKIRWACLWWRKWPEYRQVERAWEKLGDSEVLAELESLSILRMQDEELAEALTNLSSMEWRQRWRARQTCLRFGGAAARALIAANSDSALSSVTNPYAQSLIRCIGRDTTARLGKGHFVCPTCYAKVTRQRVKWRRYFGCRLCGRSHNVVPVQRWVICTLDRQASDTFERGARDIYISWSAGYHLPDCDRVEVVNVGDEEVESFVIAIHNDTDGDRRKRYWKATCVVRCADMLSQNSLRLLGQTFRDVRFERTNKQYSAIAVRV